MTPANETAVRKELLETNDEYQALYTEHQDSEQRLVELSSKSLLSEEDELEEKRIKRHKLFLKDRMETILRSEIEAVVTAGS